MANVSISEDATSPKPPAELIARLALRHAGPASTPRATYRLQLHEGFTFADAADLITYLDELGIDALYASPHFKASPGSQHGYDVTDYGLLNPEIGTRDDYDRLTGELRRRGMSLLVDFVPNHMGVAGGANRWWLDVLENGRTSAYDEFFDIDWRPLKRELREKVLLPVLGDHYGVVLERGDLKLRSDDGSFVVDYFDTPLPIAPPAFPLILRPALDRLIGVLPEDDLAVLELESVTNAFDRLPSNDERDPERIQERQREQIVAKLRLATIAETYPTVAEAMAASIIVINGQPGDPSSFDQLDHLLEAQSYRLAFWRVAAEEINYRRFFAINELAAIRQESPAVFAETHRLLLEQIGDGRVAGVRIDHPDGLWDPAGYFRQLQREAFLARCHAEVEREQRAAWIWDDLREPLATWWDQDAPFRLTRGEPGPLYLLGEKIIEAEEELPANWLVHGTVGYEFAGLATGLFVDPANRKAFTALYTRFTGLTTSYDALVSEMKALIMRVALASEVNVLALALNRISEQRRRTRDFTFNLLRFALREIIACFPVYRTYVVCDEGIINDRDRGYIERAVNRAKRRNPASDVAVFDFIRDVLLLRYAPDATEDERAEQCRFSMKFQQLTGPVMAKGVEDTTFYIYNRLTSLNEVGGDPTRFGVSVEEFHAANAERLRRWPHALLSSSTHDTKRSEDVRARIDVLSEIPREWRAALNRWRRFNRRLKTKVDGQAAPDANDEYLFYQTLLGVWPFGVNCPDEELTVRLVAYMLKAIHEAQVHTSWINPNQEYDEATERFVRSALSRETAAPFLDDVAVLRQKVAHYGAINSLAQQLLKLTSPGVPDIYQGTELWDFSLVDPDNRRPVDFDRRRTALAALRKRPPSLRLAALLLREYEDGRIKLYLTHRALALRRSLPELFRHGAYAALDARGRQHERVFAYARRDESAEVIVAVPRLVHGLTKGERLMPVGAEFWGDTRLELPDAPARSRYRDAFTGETIAVSGESLWSLALAKVFAVLPFALLERLPDEGRSHS